MILKILLTLAVVVGVFGGYVSNRPAEMHVTRELTINAAPETLFPFINNAQKADEWMPWKDSDPDVKMEYSGPIEGVGAKSSWNSKGQMGTGEALVTESQPNKFVKTQLTYTKPFQMVQTAEISLTPVDSGTKVQWSVRGQNNLFFKLLGVFMDCDKMVGSEFEKGLAKLKILAEAVQPAKKN